MERNDAVIALRLQPELNIVFIGKGAQRGFVITGWRIHHAQHQCINMLTDRYFDLRQAIADRQTAHQLGQQRQQPGDLGREDLAALHVGDKTAALFVKTDQRLALFDDMLDRKTGALAIAPGLPVDRAQDGFRLDLADVPQGVFENALLDSDLRPCVQMLHRTAAAHAEMFAPGLHAHSRRLVYLGDLRQLERRLLAVRAVTDYLAGQRAFDEDHLAFDARNTATFLVEGFNFYSVFCGHIICRNAASIKINKRPNGLSTNRKPSITPILFATMSQTSKKRYPVQPCTNSNPIPSPISAASANMREHVER